MKTETASFALLLMDLRSIESSLRRIKGYQTKINPKMQPLIDKQFEKLVPMANYIAQCTDALQKASIDCLNK